jgi:hypothetical protein
LAALSLIPPVAVAWADGTIELGRAWAMSAMSCSICG